MPDNAQRLGRPRMPDKPASVNRPLGMTTELDPDLLDYVRREADDLDAAREWESARAEREREKSPGPAWWMERFER